MKIIKISGISLLLCLIAISIYSAHLINSRKNLEAPLVHAGNIPDLEIPKKDLLKHQVCPKFPVKIFSQTVEKLYEEVQSMCLVTYKGHKLGLSNLDEATKALINVFKGTHLKYKYGDMSNRELIGVAYELPAPKKRLFYYLPVHFNDATIYMLRSLDRALDKSDSYTKYDHSKFNIYVWEQPNPEFPKHQVVKIFSDNIALGCQGELCLEYLQAIDVI